MDLNNCALVLQAKTGLSACEGGLGPPPASMYEKMPWYASFDREVAGQLDSLKGFRPVSRSVGGPDAFYGIGATASGEMESLHRYTTGTKH